MDEYFKGVRFPELLIYIFGFLFFIVLAIFSLLLKKDKVFITGGSNVLMLDGSYPDKESVGNFIFSLQSATRNFYKSKFAIIDLYFK